MVQLSETEKKEICALAAEHLSELRRILRMSQARFGELAGISRARIIRVENGTAELSWGQLTSALFICFGNARAKEYLYEKHVLSPRFLQYLQQKDANIPPDTNLTVNAELMAFYREQIDLSDASDAVVVFSKEERLAFAAHILDLLPKLRRVLQMSQATLSDLAGLSRARLIQLEKKKVRLSWSQMTSLLLVCLSNIRAKEYLYANNVLPPRFLQYVQQKKGTVAPDTGICVPDSVLPSYRELLAFADSYTEH